MLFKDYYDKKGGGTKPPQKGSATLTNETISGSCEYDPGTVACARVCKALRVSALQEKRGSMIVISARHSEQTHKLAEGCTARASQRGFLIELSR